MDDRPIGVFDSGLGGLTAVRALMDLLPDEDIVYLGDTGRVPYGGRSRETIIKYARQDLAFLTGFDLKAVVVACGTVSTTALDALTDEFPLPVIGVVAPTAERAAAVTKNGRVGIIGTLASIKSGAYDRAILARRPDAKLVSEACPLLVPLVENGRTERGDPLIELAVSEYLAPMRAADIDTLVMGCTHYPLIGGVIADFMGGGVSLISPGEETAKHVAELLRQNGLSARAGRRAEYRYFVTDSTEGFEKAATGFLRRSLAGRVEKTDLSVF